MSIQHSKTTIISMAAIACGIANKVVLHVHGSGRVQRFVGITVGRFADSLPEEP
jgi:hypothetical protein